VAEIGVRAEIGDLPKPDVLRGGETEPSDPTMVLVSV
jgi:hypothetical protein